MLNYITVQSTPSCSPQYQVRVWSVHDAITNLHHARNSNVEQYSGTHNVLQIDLSSTYLPTPLIDLILM